MYEDSIRNLLAAVWYQALKDFKKNQKDNFLRDWILNEGRMLCTPHFSRREAEETLNEYISK